MPQRANRFWTILLATVLFDVASKRLAVTQLSPPYVAHNVIAGKLTGKAGESFTAGKLGKRTVGPAQTVIFDKPLVFTKANVDQFHF